MKSELDKPRERKQAPESQAAGQGAGKVKVSTVVLHEDELGSLALLVTGNEAEERPGALVVCQAVFKLLKSARMWIWRSRINSLTMQATSMRGKIITLQIPSHSR